MMPFYLCAPQLWIERAFYGLFPLWKAWLQAQEWPACHVMHAMMGFATEPFDRADESGALKVVDCPNSHPTSYYGYWQRECDLWCPGEKVPIPHWMFARMSRELERADLVICPSTFVRDSMVQNGLDGDKCFINPFGADTTTFIPREKVPESPRFICVGTICVRKGHQYLFRAFERVKKQMPAAELICVGAYKKDFRKERPRWEGTFTHYPSLTHEQLAVLLRSCSAFVFPSQEEGFARVILEAMSAALPIIATHESGASTLVEHGTEGFIVHGHSVDEMSEAMIRLGSDLTLNEKMGEAAHQKGAVSNTWQDYGDRLLAEYERRVSL